MVVEEFVDVYLFGTYSIMPEFASPEVRKDGYKTSFLSWICTYPGWLSGESTSM